MVWVWFGLVFFLAWGIALYLGTVYVCFGNGKLAFVFEKVYVHRSVLFFSFAFPPPPPPKDKTYSSSRSRALFCWEGWERVWHEKVTPTTWLLATKYVSNTYAAMGLYTLSYRSKQVNRSTEGWREHGVAIPALQEKGTKSTSAFERISLQYTNSLWMVAQRTKAHRVKWAFPWFLFMHFPFPFYPPPHQPQA